MALMLNHLYGEDFVSSHTAGNFLAATGDRVTPCPLLGTWEKGWLSSLSRQPNSASPPASTAQPPTTTLATPPVGPGSFSQRGSPNASLLILQGGSRGDPRGGSEGLLPWPLNIQCSDRLLSISLSFCFHLRFKY